MQTKVEEDTHEKEISPQLDGRTRRAELRRKAKEAERTRERQAAAAAQNEAEESDATEEEATRGRARREGGDREVAPRLKRESERDCEER